MTDSLERAKRELIQRSFEAMRSGAAATQRGRDEISRSFSEQPAAALQRLVQTAAEFKRRFGDPTRAGPTRQSG